MKHTPSNPKTCKSSKCRPLYGLIRLAAILSAFASVSSGATVSIGVQHWGIGDVDLTAPSNADLVNSGSPDLLYFNSTAMSGALGVFDGNSGGALIEESADQFPAIITLTLNSLAHPLGYEINSIRSLSHGVEGGLLGVSDSRMQYYKLEYSVVGDAGFTTLLTVDIRDFEPEGPDPLGGSTWVTLLDIEDELTGVDAIKFTWMDPSAAFSSSASWIGEIDIVGAPVTQVPEPGAGMLLLGAASLLRRRVRSH